MRNYLLSSAALSAAALALTACSAGDKAGATASSNGVTELRYQGAANAVTLPELAEDLGFFNGKVKLKWVGQTTSGPQDIQSAATNQTDFGGAFAGAVVKLIEAGAPVTAVINYYGSDDKSFIGYYVKQNSPIRSAHDLIGKKIGVNTLGAHSEAVIDTYLEKNGLRADEIKQVQLVVVPPNNTEEALRKGQIDAGALSGVLQDHAVAAGGLRSLFSDVSLFGPFDGGQYVLRNDFIKANPDAAKAFVSGVARAIEWERTTPRTQVIAEFTKIIDGRQRGESTDNLKYWKSVGIPARGGVITDGDFSRWIPWLKQAGIITGDGLDFSKLYTNSLNSYATGSGS